MVNMLYNIIVLKSSMSFCVIVMLIPISKSKIKNKNKIKIKIKSIIFNSNILTTHYLNS